MDETWLPPRIRMEHYGGDWDSYLEAVYTVFRRDFLTSRPTFCGQRIELKRHPIEDGKEATFWHFIQEGEVEADRLPKFGRMECVPWIRPILEAVGSRADLKVWEQRRRKGERRIAVATEDFSFLIVVAERSRADGSIFHLAWTAYPVEREHQRQKYRKEWERSGPCTILGFTFKRLTPPMRTAS